MLSLINLLLVGGVLGLSLVSAFASLRVGRARTLWFAKFVGIVALLAWLFFTRAELAGWVGLAAWMILVWLPSLAVARSVRWAVLERYDRAERWARWAPLLHPADGMVQQREMIAILRRLDAGEIDEGLAALRALDEAHPGNEFWVPADEHRFRGDWQKVREVIEAETDEAQRAANARTAVPYLVSLGETGDLRAMLDFWQLCQPRLAPLRRWCIPQYAQLAMAVAFGRRDLVDELLAGPMADMLPESAAVARATARMSSGDVEGGREELRSLRDRVNHGNQLFIDRRLERLPVLAEDVFPEGVPEIEAGPVAPPTHLSRVRRVVRGIAMLVILAVAVSMWAPWRSQGPADEHGATLGYLERIVGKGEADPESPLPLLVDIHGYGAIPELHGGLFDDLPFPVRLVLPAGPDFALVGRSWYEYGEWEEQLDGIRGSAARIAALVRHLSETRPTRGAPVVTGFSQGGTLAYALAALHPDVIAVAVPVAASLPTELMPEVAPSSPPPVVAFHGEDDQVTEPRWARETADELDARGWDVELTLYPGVEHELSGDMRHAVLDAVAQMLSE